MSKKKVLVVHASAGAGHKKAAEAVYNALKESGHYEAHFADVLDYTNPFYKYSYQKTYTYLVTKTPLIWALFFKLTDLKILRPLVRVLRRILNSVNAKTFEKFLKKEQFDCIVSTHFFPNEVPSSLKRQGMIASKVISVVTDFDVHSLWMASGVDFYTGACNFTKDKLINLGAAPEKIIVTGIPTDRKFSQAVDKDQLRQKLGVKNGIFTVLVATGSFGMGPIETLVEGLKGFQVMVVCGNNKELFSRLKAKETELVKIFGLVNNMDELMSVADAMITKPGGLSTSEALVKGLPLIFFSAIPGQEENNVRILSRYGIGMLGSDIESIIAEVKKLSSSNEYFHRAKENIKQLASPAAVSKIIQLIG